MSRLALQITTQDYSQSVSSCSAEHVFSILNDSFTEDQRSAYADYMELSLQLQYNTRGRK